MSVRRTGWLIAAVVICSALPMTAAAQPPNTSTPPKTSAPATKAQGDDKGANPDAMLLKDFKNRIDQYVAIHNQVKKDVPPMKETNNPEEIKNAQTAFGERLRQVRANAKAGDIFTPEIQQKFRRLLRPELKGEDGQDARKVLKDDAPPSVPLKVNANYPAGASLPTVPASLLLNLPTLPEALEYRIINKHLILRDTSGNIIVDFIPNAIP